MSLADLQHSGAARVKCAGCDTYTAGVFACQACGIRRNSRFLIGVGLGWGAVLTTSIAVLAALLVWSSINQRDRDARIAGRERQLAGQRELLASLRHRVVAFDSRTARRRKVARTLQRQAPTIRKQLAGVTGDLGDARAVRDRLQSYVESGELAPGVEP